MNPTSFQTAPDMPIAHIKSWLAVLAGLVVMLAVFTGVQLARGNSDIACFKTLTEEGACSNGSWGSWQVISQSTQGCTTVVQESRVYTGTREVITSIFDYRTSSHAHCDINWARQAIQANTDAGPEGGGASGNIRSGTGIIGTITYQYAACQIRNDRTRSIVSTTGDCAGTTEVGGIVSETNTNTTGNLIGTATSTTGSYQDYLDYINSRLATSTIVAVPAFVRVGDKVDVSWTASHVRSCAVVGSNGDGPWPVPETTENNGTGSDANGGAGPMAIQNNQTSQQTTDIVGSHQSSPITQQTTYTLTCTRAVGAPLVGTATVNLLPIFQEQ